MNDTENTESSNLEEVATDNPTTESAPPVEIVEPSALEKAETELIATKDKLLRMAADFDNFRKRSRREAEDALKKGRENLLKDLLPVFDNIERAAAHADSSTGENPDAEWKGLVDGIELVTRQFRDTLGRSGIERVDAVGKAFDPGVHEAIQHLETNEFEPGHVAAEVQAGYREGERLVRPALVVVAKALPEPPADEPAEQDEEASASS